MGGASVGVAGSVSSATGGGPKAWAKSIISPRHVEHDSRCPSTRCAASGPIKPCTNAAASLSSRQLIVSFQQLAHVDLDAALDQAQDALELGRLDPQPQPQPFGDSFHDRVARAVEPAGGGGAMDLVDDPDLVDA